MSGRSRSRTPSARARTGAVYQAAKTAKGAQITGREQRADSKRHLIEAIAADQSRVKAGNVRVIYVIGAQPDKEHSKVIERVAQKHAADGTRLRPFQRVYRGHALRTVGGLMQADVMRWKGRIVSKKAHAAGMKAFKTMPAAEKRAFLDNSGGLTPRRSSRKKTATKRLGFGGAPAGGDGYDSDGGDSDGGDSYNSQL